MKINAWAAPNKGGPLIVERYGVEPHQGQVVIDVDSCSLTRGDVRFIDNYWGDTKYPLVTGLEVMGRVRENLGEQRRFKPGDVVGVGYQVGACFACEYCKAGKEQFCAKQQLIPFQAKGGLADVIVVDERFVFGIPKNLQTPEATPLLCAGLTVYTPIHEAGLAMGASVAVVGLGSLGHLAVLFLVAMGCKVTAFTHSDRKVAVAKELGAEVVITDTEPAPERAFDFIISCAADGVDWERYIRALKPTGTLCIVGLPTKPVSFAPELLADYAARCVVGSYIGSRRDMEAMLDFAAKHHILAKAKIYPMQDINIAVQDMREGKVDFSAVLTNKITKSP